mmetsp:Transcript_33581/g.101486  ORF Transcript_33581/g.101486 Transcript_33581/m.101486 type:complete len:219 (+) Transcript_33581:215-871(+)
MVSATGILGCPRRQRRKLLCVRRAPQERCLDRHSARPAHGQAWREGQRDPVLHMQAQARCVCAAPSPDGVGRRGATTSAAANQEEGARSAADGAVCRSQTRGRCCRGRPTPKEDWEETARRTASGDARRKGAEGARAGGGVARPKGVTQTQCPPEESKGPCRHVPSECRCQPQAAEGAGGVGCTGAGTSATRGAVAHCGGRRPGRRSTRHFGSRPSRR